MADLTKGCTVPLENGETLKVLEKLGEGGQGTVYKVDFAGKPCALKWYAARKLKSPIAFQDNLRKNIGDGPPSGNFLWPHTLTKRDGQGNFGYVMDLRPAGFADFSDILNNKPGCRLGLHALVESALQIVSSFRALHLQGKSYQDLNDGNFFLNPQSGAVLICDNDNVSPDQQNLGIGGKPGYVAPEIVRGEARPDTLTDQHSLAVVLFKLLLRHDPLMGKAYVASVCITEETEKRLYGEHPVFIFDPKDDSNRPVPGVHPNPIKLWPHYPAYVQDAFIKSFCEGMKNRNARLTEKEWLYILIRLRGEILTCACGAEYFASSVKKQVTNNLFSCPACKLQCSYPLQLQTNANIPVLLFPGNRLYACHTQQGSEDWTTEQGKVVTNKNQRSIWGIKNESQAAWVTSAEGTDSTVVPGGIAIIQENLKITFQQVTGSIVKES